MKIEHNTQRNTYRNIIDACRGADVKVYCIPHQSKWALIFDINGAHVVMASSRHDTRLFSSIDSARRSCAFIEVMHVIGS